MSKRILIVSYLFEPLNEIGAIRPTKLAKYLSASGYEVDVYTSATNLVSKVGENREYKVIYSGDNPLITSNMHKSTSINHSAKSKISKQDNKFIQDLKMTYRQARVIRSGFKFLDDLKKDIKDKKFDIEKYDFVFSTYGPIGSLLIGMYLKKIKPNIKWICDFRDPMVVKDMSTAFRFIYDIIQKKSVKQADYVTTVSEGYADRILKGTKNIECYVIPNGYDSDDKKIVNYTKNNDKKIKFTYVGLLYEGKRDLSPLFECISSLVANEKNGISINDFVFEYAGTDFSYLYGQAQKYGIQEILHNNNLLPREECLKLQSQSDILVLSTWNEQGEEGVFPGKTIEYMLINKPIINIVNGNLKNSEVTRVIEKYNLGVSFEEADSGSKERLYNWLEAQCIYFQKNFEIKFEPDKEGIDSRYNWCNLVKKFQEIIEK